MSQVSRGRWEEDNYDGDYFRKPTPAQREILDRARHDYIQGFLHDDDNAVVAAQMTMRKILQELTIQKETSSGDT